MMCDYCDITAQAERYGLVTVDETTYDRLHQKIKELISTIRSDLQKACDYADYEQYIAATGYLKACLSAYLMRLGEIEKML